MTSKSHNRINLNCHPKFLQNLSFNLSAMDTLLIQLTSHKAEKLIKDLEDLKITKILERDSPKENFQINSEPL